MFWTKDSSSILSTIPFIPGIKTIPWKNMHGRQWKIHINGLSDTTIFVKSEQLLLCHWQHPFCSSRNTSITHYCSWFGVSYNSHQHIITLNLTELHLPYTFWPRHSPPFLSNLYPRRQQVPWPQPLLRPLIPQPLQQCL